MFNPILGRWLCSLTYMQYIYYKEDKTTVFIKDYVNKLINYYYIYDYKYKLKHSFIHIKDLMAGLKAVVINKLIRKK